MRHGCYKLCPRVREQLRQAREAQETPDGSESESSGRNEAVAGPSGVTRDAEKNREKGKSRKPKVQKRKDYDAAVSRAQRKGKSHGSRKNAKRSFDHHDMCDRSCRGIDELMERMENEKQQESFDEYIMNKGLCYFQDLCNCHYACLIDQLWRDPFVTSTIASAALFAIGLKLCSELDGWRIF